MARHTARFLAGAADPARFPPLPYPEIAFAGRSNVGKSSLLNRLVGQRGLARVSKTPGRTQQVNFFLVDERVTFADLPGYGFARVPPAVQSQWKRLVESYLSGRKNLRAVVIIVDLRRGIEDDDRQLCEYLGALGVPVLLVATKSDKLGYAERQSHTRALAQARMLGIVAVLVCSAHRGEGIPQLWTRLDALAQRSRVQRPRPES